MQIVLLYSWYCDFAFLILYLCLCIFQPYLHFIFVSIKVLFYIGPILDHGLGSQVIHHPPFIRNYQTHSSYWSFGIFAGTFVFLIIVIFYFWYCDFVFLILWFCIFDIVILYLCLCFFCWFFFWFFVFLSRHIFM